MICFHCGKDVEDWQVPYYLKNGSTVHFNCKTAADIIREPSYETIHNDAVFDNSIASLEKPVKDVRQFESGATRDTDDDKLDFEGFLSPLVIQAYAEYMHENRQQSDGNFRSSDNWQKGMPLDCYMKSGWRHFFDWWKEHRGYSSRDGMIKALCGLLFNVQGYLHELLKEKLTENTDE